MAGNARSRSRTRRPPLQPLHPPSGIAPPPRPRTPLRPPLRTKARSVGPVVPDINRQGPPYLMIHRSGTTAPKAPPELPPRHTPRFPKLIANYIKHYQDLQKSAPNQPKRTNLTNEFFTERRTLTPPPRIRPTPRAVFQKAEARAQHHDWADFNHVLRSPLELSGTYGSKFV